MSKLQEVIDQIIQIEGGYVNNPSDRGGETNFGITLATARSYGYSGSIKDLPLSIARDIYFNRYIVKPGFKAIYDLNADIGMELIDTGVNMGTATAAMMLQRLLNVVYPAAKLFVDGAIGNITLNALSAYLRLRPRDGVTILVHGLNGLQAARYIDIAERNANQTQFINGWLANRIT